MVNDPALIRESADAARHQSDLLTGPQKTPAAIVLSAGANGLGAIRSLALARIPVIVLATDSREPALFSRYPLSRVVAADPSDEGLLRALNGLRQGRHVVIATSDRFVSFLQRNGDQLRDSFDFCLPPGTLAATLIDKVLETELIEHIGVPLPRTIRVFPPAPAELIDSLGLPIIIKPRSFQEVGLLGRKNLTLRTLGDVETFYRRFSDLLGGFLAQEVVPGADDLLWVCNCCFDADGGLLSAFTFRRLRTAPAHFGVTSYAVSERNPAIVDIVAKLGRRIGYTGPAMVEFKADPRDGVPKYLELNPRLGMCNYFDTCCGVNNVAISYWLARGEKPPGDGNPPQRDGVMFLSLWDDFYARVKDGERIPTIIRHYAGNRGRPHVGAYFAWGDPYPGVVMSWRHLWELARGAARRLRAAVGAASGAS